MHNLRRFALFVVLLVALLLPLSLFAATNGGIGNDTLNFFPRLMEGPPQECGDYIMQFDVTFTGTTEDTTEPPRLVGEDTLPGGPRDMVALLVYDASGVRLQNADGGLTIEILGTIGFQTERFAESSMVGITARPVTIALYDTGPEYPTMSFTDEAARAQYIEQNAALLATKVADPAEMMNPDGRAQCALLPLLAPFSPPSGGGGSGGGGGDDGGDDGGPVGLAPGFGDSRLANLPVDVAIYPSADGIMVYGVNNASEGFMAAYVSAADLPAEPPAQNTLLAQSSDGYYSIYMLSTGEYQVNVGPTPDGWVRVMIFSSLSPNAAVTRADFHVSSVTP